MAKRGRRRKAGKRVPNGRLNWRVQAKIKEGPTQELLAKRIAALQLVGCKPEKISLSTLNLAESWFGLMYAADIIDAAQYQAGNKYHGLYKTLFPQGWTQTNLTPYVDASQAFEPLDDDQLEDIELAWRSTEKVLKELGRATHDVVKNVCVYGRFQRFMDTTLQRSPQAWKSDAKAKTRFIEGLEALAVAYGIRDRVKAVA